MCGCGYFWEEKTCREDLAISSTCATWVRRLRTWSLMLEHMNSLFLKGVLEAVSDSPMSLKTSTVHVNAQICSQMFPDQNDSLAEAGLRPYYFEPSSTCSTSSSQSVPERLHGLDDLCSLTNTWASLPSGSFHMLELLPWHPNINGKCLFNTESYSLLAFMSKP